MTTKTYRCNWCGYEFTRPWRSPQQPLDRCPMCGKVAVQEGTPSVGDRDKADD